MSSGDVIALPGEVAYPSSNPATPRYTGGRVQVWKFDDAITQSVLFQYYMTKIYDGSGNIIVRVPWKFETYVGSQTVDWELSVARLASTDDAESLTYAAAVTSEETESGTSGAFVYSDFTFTNAQFDAIGIDQLFQLQLTRDATGGTPAPGNAQACRPIILQA